MAGDGSLVRILAAGVVALVVGLGLGGIGPRGEIRTLKKQLEALEDRSCEGGGLGQQFAEAFSRRPWERGPDAEPQAAPREPGEPAEPVAVADPEGSFRLEIDGEEQVIDPENSEQTLSLARDAMAMRQRQALAALEEGARPDEAQLEHIETAIADMNAELRYLTEGFVQQVRDGEPSRRDAMVFAADTLDVIIEADDRLFEALDEDQRAAVDAEALDPMSYVDPGLVDLFAELGREAE